MKSSDLEKRLLAQGCNPHNFCIGSDPTKSDVYCLAERDGIWTVYYTERGIQAAPIFESGHEEEACQYYFDKIMSFAHWHLVGFFEQEENAQRLQAELRAMGIEPIRNDMPPLQMGGPPIKRVFVVGKQLFEVQKLHNHLPLKDA